MPKKNLSNKLDRFSSLIKNGASKSRLKAPPARYTTLADAVGGQTILRQAGTYCLIKTVYPLSYRHGNFRIGLPKAETLPLSAFTALGESGELDINSMLFIDTETTGLGGAGAVAFLIGCASVTPDGFEIRQYLLPDYSDEAAMLEDILEEFTAEKVLVSYNGATFDLPLIRDRMIINRVASSVEYDHHVDLLHSTRRLFKRRLQDCTLTNIEEKLFDFYRSDDIPGYLIPAVYFDWLSGDNFEMMTQVLEHNRLDIVSLLCLIHHIAQIHGSQGEVLDEVYDLHSLSRLFGRRKETDLVRQVFGKIDSKQGSDLADDIVLYHSMNFKRVGQFDQAVEMWQRLSRANSKESYWANLELAKHYEHREKDIGLALKYARDADRICPYGDSHRNQLAKRLNRLKTRLKQQ